MFYSSNEISTMYVHIGFCLRISCCLIIMGPNPGYEYILSRPYKVTPMSLYKSSFSFSPKRNKNILSYNF